MLGLSISLISHLLVFIYLGKKHQMAWHQCAKTFLRGSVCQGFMCLVVQTAPAHACLEQDNQTKNEQTHTTHHDENQDVRTFTVTTIL